MDFPDEAKTAELAALVALIFSQEPVAHDVIDIMDVLSLHVSANLMQHSRTQCIVGIIAMSWLTKYLHTVLMEKYFWVN